MAEMDVLPGNIRTWETLSCVQCEGTSMLALVELRAKPGGGTTTAQRGWQCASCHTQVNIADMQRVAYLKQRRAEMEALEREFAAEVPAPVPTPAPATSGVLTR